MSDVKELKDEELEKVTGGNTSNKAKYQKGEEVCFKFIRKGEANILDSCTIIGRGIIENVYIKNGSYYYDIHHPYMTLLTRIQETLMSDYISERTEIGIPETDINYTGQF